MNEINDDFSCFAKSSVDTSVEVLRGRPYGGIALMWRKSKLLNVSVIECENAKIKIDTRSLIIFSVYLPTDTYENLPDFTDCLARINSIIEENSTSAVYILGDFNAHPTACFGKELLRFCKEHNLVCADLNMLGTNSDTYTFISDAHGSQRWLDHCVVTEAAWSTVTSVEVLYDTYTSDHLPLRVVCNIDCVSVTGMNINCDIRMNDNVKWGNRNASQIESYFNYCNAKLYLLNDVLKCIHCDNNERCERKAYHFKFIDRLYCDIVNVLRDGAMLSARGCPGDRRKVKRVTGWNMHVRDSHQEARMYFRYWCAAGRPSTGEIYENMCTSRRNFKNKLRWCQNNEEMIKLDILTTHERDKNFIKFWNATKKLNYKQSLPVSVDGAQNPREIAELFAGKFKTEPEPVAGLSLGDRLEGSLTIDPPTIRFTLEDVQKAIKQMKRGKSPGHDGLSIEHIVCAGDVLRLKLCTLYNACLRFGYLPNPMMRTIVVPVVKNKTGDLSAARNYRPISLGTVLGKVLERLMQPMVQKSMCIDDAQFGFRPGLSTDSAILSLKHTVNYYTRRNTPVYACFLDLSRAFDLVNYEILWRKMRDSKVPRELICLLKYWYGNQINNVRWGDATSSDYRLDCGVRQGGLTSPDLFSLYVNDLIGELRGTKVGCHLGSVCVNNLSYADDMVLLSPSIGGLRKLLSVCEHYARAHGLKYNVQKTEMMVFRSGKGPENIFPVCVGGSPIRVVQEFKYLGHVLTSDQKDDDDIERERRALAVRCNMLARRFAKCSVGVKTALFKAYCQSFYTCQLWVNFRRASLSTMRVQYNDAFRILMKHPRFCSASSMFAEARVPDFFAIVRARIASFWERIRSSRNAILMAISDDYASHFQRYWLTIHRDTNRK